MINLEVCKDTQDAGYGSDDGGGPQKHHLGSITST
jgi:hypothetical protein